MHGVKLHRVLELSKTSVAKVLDLICPCNDPMSVMLSFYLKLLKSHVDFNKYNL